MKKYIISIILMAVAVFSVVSNPDNLNFALLIGTAAGGIGTAFQFNITYLPEFLIWNDAGAPINFLRIDTQDRGVLLNLLAADIVQFNGIINVGALAANANRIILADGHIPGQNVTISGTTSAVGAINFFGSSDNAGVSMFKYTSVAVIANNETQFDKFSILSLPGLVTVTDRVQVFYKDGHAQVYDSVELASLSTMYNDAPVIVINNLASNIDKVLVTSVLGVQATVMKVDI